MINMPEYQIIAMIYESSETFIYRAWRISDNMPVIIKVTKGDYPSPEQLNRYQKEFNILSGLQHHGVIKSIALEKINNRLAIIFEDIGGDSLKYLLQTGTFTITDLIKIAVSITEVLKYVHSMSIMHRDINPSNIVINQKTGQLKIIDFGLANQFLLSPSHSHEPDIGMEGSIHYMSPEQTGRMKRTVDYRTDFYSLGVTLYELFTHTLPFSGADPLEIVHAHIAKVPMPPINRRSDVPKIVSDIILKLIAKAPEERYQSARGILFDLQESLIFIEEKKPYDQFVLGTHDLQEKFRIPQKLYGRQKDIDTLMSGFFKLSDRIPQSFSDIKEKNNLELIIENLRSKIKNRRSEMILVIGEAGIGKTSLIRQLYQPVTQHHAFFISGKFDRFKRNIPYHGFIQILREMTKQILAEPEDKLRRWQKKLIHAVGPNARLIIDSIPEMELLLGNPPPISDLSPAEARNRVNVTSLNIIKIFANQENPLVVFFDDIQWADRASLQLIHLILTSNATQYVYIIGAYRDKEVPQSHPLNMTVEEIKKGGGIVNYLNLSPLESENIVEMICDMFNCDNNTARPLAEIILKKTHGNPFFIGEFLKSLYDDHLITFDSHSDRWTWNITQLQAQSITENVVELMTEKIQKLPNQTQELLKVASCVGKTFNLDLISKLLDKNYLETVSIIKPALSEGLILEGTTDANSDIAYQFSHGRIHHAAYSLLGTSLKKEIHRNIGLYLLEKNPESERSEIIFDIVNHFNVAIDLITKEKEKEHMANLNLVAGTKARIAGTYEASTRYLTTALNLLGQNKWETHYALTRNLYLESLRSAYLSGDYEQLDLLTHIILEHMSDSIERIQVYEVLIHASISRNKLEEAISTALYVLKTFGIKFPDRPNKFHIIKKYLEIKFSLLGKNIQEFENAKLMDDTKILSCMRIMGSIFSPAYLIKPSLYPLLVLKGVQLSLRYGNSTESIFCYSSFGAILCGKIGDIETGYQFGKLALSLTEKMQKQRFAARIMMVVGSFIVHWKEHAKQTLPVLLSGYNSGMETGDLEYATYSGFAHACYSFCLGKELSKLENKISKFSDVLASINKGVPLNKDAIRQAIANLMGNSKDPSVLSGEYYDVEKSFSLHTQENNKLFIFIIYFIQLILCYIFRKFDKANKYADNCREYLEGGINSFAIPVYFFYDSLTLLALYNGAKAKTKKQILRKVRKNQKKIRFWAKHSPMNHQHKYLLVQAEIMRVLKQDKKAMSLYEEAIYLANVNEYMNEEAVANELAGRFFLERTSTIHYDMRSTIAKSFLMNARYCYLKWGAMAKVSSLDEEFRDIFPVSFPKRPWIKDSISSTMETNSGQFGDGMDLSSVMKALQAISSEIVFDKLLDKLIHIVIENAGADKGFFILKKGEDLFIEATANTSQFETYVNKSLQVDQCSELCLSIVNYVARTHESVVLGNAPEDTMFAKDIYIITNRPRSILCLPIKNHGKLTGVLYLENKETIDAFTPSRKEIIKMLASQAAISIENSKLYTQLEESEKKYRGIFENVIEGIFQATPEGQVLSANPAMIRIMGYENPTDDFDGFRPINGYVDPADFRNLIKSLRKDGQVVDFETQFYRKDKSIIWVSISAREIRDQQGTLLHYEGTVVDITSRKEKESAERDRRAAEAANEAKSKFLASMSHEIRTPMNAILGMADLLWESDLNDEQKKYVQVFRNAGESLLNLINDILDLSKIESGQLVLEYARFDLLELVEKTCEVMALKVHKKKLEMLVHIRNNTPISIIGDSVRLRQIIVNLIGNAVKFTHEGEIELSVRYLRDINTENGNKIEMLFSVRDTGIGIAPDKYDKIFQRYLQADVSTTRQYGGTGLGLSICKQLVEMMGGRIWVESEIGKGSIFYFTAQFGIDKQSPQEAKNPNLTNLKVFIVDDNPSSRLILKDLIGSWGAEITEFETGESCIEQLKILKESALPMPIIILDCYLSLIDGFRIAELIKMRFENIQNNIVMLLTSDDSRNQISKTRHMGINHYIVKPIKQDDLKQVFIKITEKDTKPTKIAEESKESKDEKELLTKSTEQLNEKALNILLVDDNEDNRTLFLFYLKKTPHKVDIAINGLIAFEMFQNNNYDIIYMDIEMPVMDGYEATKKIREWEKTHNKKSTLIVALTAHAFKGHQEQILEAGCTSYMTKPFKKAELLKNIQQYIEQL